MFVQGRDRNLYAVFARHALNISHEERHPVHSCRAFECMGADSTRRRAGEQAAPSGTNKRVHIYTPRPPKAGGGAPWHYTIVIGACCTVQNYRSMATGFREHI